MSARLDCGPATLRAWQESDEPSIVRYGNNKRVSRNLRDRFPHPYTLADAHAWVTAVSDESPLVNFAIDVDGEAIGGIGLVPQTDVFRCSAEIGYWLGEPFWNRGIATAAVVALTTYGFRQLDLERIHAGVYEWNPASMRTLEKAGYVREGVARRSVIKDGQLIDRVLFAALRAEWLR
jgi:RimJ/RimL family protein N-acetyltransferase